MQMLIQLSPAKSLVFSRSHRRRSPRKSILTRARPSNARPSAPRSLAVLPPHTIACQDTASSSPTLLRVLGSRSPPTASDGATRLAGIALPVEIDTTYGRTEMLELKTCLNKGVPNLTLSLWQKPAHPDLVDIGLDNGHPKYCGWNGAVRASTKDKVRTYLPTECVSVSYRGIELILSLVFLDAPTSTDRRCLL